MTLRSNFVGISSDFAILEGTNNGLTNEDALYGPVA